MALQDLAETLGSLYGQYAEGRRQIEEAKRSTRSISTAPIPRENPMPWVLIAVGGIGLAIMYVIARRR